MEKKWYSINVINGKERTIKEYMEKMLEMSNLNRYVQEIIIPVEKVKSIKNGKPSFREKSILPGYMFILCELNGEIERLVKDITNVKGFVGANKKPEFIPEHEMESILERMDKNIELDSTFEDVYIVGEKVKIIDGPFSNFDATVQEVLNDKNRIKVSVKIFGRDTIMELMINQIDRMY